MEEMDTPQLVLLNIMVAFVVSIATTIISISLLSDTPLSITQVVNQVTEKERLVDAQVDGIKEEILAQIELPEPVVAGVATQAILDTNKIEQEAQAVFDGQFYGLAKDAMLTVPNTEERYDELFDENGVFEIKLGDLLLLHNSDFESLQIGIGVAGLNEDLAAYDPISSRIERTYVARAMDIMNIQDNGYEIAYLEVDSCQAGSLVFNQAAELVGVCIGSNRVAIGVARVNLSEQDEILQTSTTEETKETAS